MSTPIPTAATSIPAQVPVKEPSWHAALPSPRNTNPESITRQELLDLLTKKRSIRDFVLVDLRRVDHVVRVLYLIHLIEQAKEKERARGRDKGRGSGENSVFEQLVGGQQKS